MISCGEALRRLGEGQGSMEAVARRAARFLYDHLRDGPDGPRACVLVRLFKTHRYGDLAAPLRDFARRLAGVAAPSPSMRCLTLLATAGDRPEWDDRTQSRGHQAIPLTSEEGLRKTPMIARLITQMGLEVGMVLRPDPDLLLDLDQRAFNVFHVPEARGSGHVPDQRAFVEPHGVRSVLGVGGGLPSGDLYTAIMFSRVPIARDTADLFRPLGLGLKLALLPFDGAAVFEGAEPCPSPPDPVARLNSRCSTLAQLLEVHEQTSRLQAERLAEANRQTRAHADQLARSEADLRRQSELLALILERMADGVVVVDERARVLVFNEAAGRMFGPGSADTPPEQWSRRCGLFLPDQVTPFPAEGLPLARAIRGESTDGVDLFVRNPGVPQGLRVVANGRPLIDGQGRLRGGVAVWRDVTALKQAEEQSADSERLYRGLIEGSRDAIVVGDERGRILLTNAAARGLFGYDEGELEGQEIMALMPHEFRAAHTAGMARFRQTRQPRVIGRTLELTGLRKDGRAFPLELSLTAIDQADGLLYLGAIRDLTERRQLQARMVQAEKLASLGLLSAGVAHEINNPLAFVGNNMAVLERDLKGLMELLDVYDQGRPDIQASRPELAERLAEAAERCDLPYIRENLPRILANTRHGVERVSNIVKNLRGFARLDQAAVDRFDIHHGIESSLEILGGQLARQDIAVERDFAEIPTIVCAPAQINQVIMNILVNSIQAVAEAGRRDGRIAITTGAGADEVFFEVADNGGGIPDAIRARVFDPFFTTKPVGQGTGLGLSISHSIVHDHGGRIEVESIHGQGCRVRVTLPVRGDALHPA